MKKIAKLSALSSALFALPMMANADVVASVKPLGFIASSIANGVTGTQVVVPAGASPHDYNLKPSDVQKLQSADLVLWVGEDVDVFLEGPIRDVDLKKTITISELRTIDPFLSHAHHEHDHGDEHHDHEHHHSHKADADEHHHKSEHAHHQEKSAEHKHDHADKHEECDCPEHEGTSINWHVWYSPEISKIVAEKVAERLTQQFPEQKAKIEQNLAEFNRTLAEQNEKIKAQLSPVKDKGFYVFHDAYGYFNNAYGLKQTGYFTINPLVAPGAKTLAKIKEEIAEHKVSCLFAEPQFTPKVIESLSKNTKVKVGRLDPMGDNVQLGANAYANFLQYTADSYSQCLSK